MIEQLCADLAEEVIDLEAQVAHRDERLREAWDAIGGQRDGVSLADAIEADQNAAWAALGEDQGSNTAGNLAERIGEAFTGYDDTIANAVDALRAYLVAQGYAANPVTLPGPLGVLCDVLL